MERPNLNTKNDFGALLRGFLMGVADTVPGISGGTVALILGHYQRLVVAIRHLDHTFIRLVVARQWSQAASHCDLRFVVGIGLGIVGGLLSFATLMHWLLEHYLPETLATFMGLVVASALIVFKQISDWNGKAIFVASIAAMLAFWICGLVETEHQPSNPFLFFAAMVSICAMILPGISGAFIMLLLGVYHPVMGLIRDFVRLNWSLEGWLSLGFFAAGCATGLALFSRLLSWLLTHHSTITYSALFGLMLGSLRKLWPLQLPISESASKTLGSSERQWVSVSPGDWPNSFWPLLLLGLLGFIAVETVHRWGCRIDRKGHQETL